MKIKVGDREVVALVDSGATRSLVKDSLVSSNHMSNAFSSGIIGLGGSRLPIIGETTVNLSLLDMDFSLDCLVVDSSGIEDDLILGIDFLRQNKVSLNMARKRMAFKRMDDSIINIYLNDDNNFSKIVYERVPVYCKNNVDVSSDQIVRIPVTFGTTFINNDTEASDRSLYYEAENDLIETMDGVMSQDSSDQYVWAKNLASGGTVKQGKVLGYAYSILTMDDENEEQTWSEQKINTDFKFEDNLSEEEKEKVKKMLYRVKEVLSVGDNDIGDAKVEPHKIEVTSSTPIWQKHRNFSQPINDEIEKQCKELVANDILEYSNSDWSSPVVPVRKGDGSLRLCVDYRQVNKVTKKENFPMPNMSNCIYRPNKVKYFTKIDLVRGYYQVPIHEQSQKYTAFSTVQSQYQFKRLSFGLKNSGMAFQRVMQQILAPVLNTNIIIYIDDVLVMTETFEEHVILVEKVLSLLASYNIKIKVSKCEMFKSQVNFLGHVINSEGIMKSPEFIQKVKNVEKPKTVKEMRQFLGLINFQRKFIKNCSFWTKPLSEWTVGARGKKIEWSEKMEDSYKKLIEEVEKEVMLAYPDYSQEASKMELYVDASGSGCGACLMQKNKDDNRVIAYASMSFSDTERRYSATDRELAALRWGIITFKCFLAGVAFVLVTDHKPLVYLNNMCSTKSRLMRTLEELAEYEFEVRYRPGIQNEAADFLSRLNDSDKRETGEVIDHKYLPKELNKICDIEGGGDSMFQALLVAMKEAKENDGYSGDIPVSHEQLRNCLVTELLEHLENYGLNKGKQTKSRLRLMKSVGQQPVDEILMAASRLYNLKVLVYHGMKSPISFVYEDTEDKIIIRLQCVSLMHYNPLYERRKIHEEYVDDKYVNLGIIKNDTNQVSFINTPVEAEVDLCNSVQSCEHSVYHVKTRVIGYTDKEYCCLLDTGAQVSLMGLQVYEDLKEAGVISEKKDCGSILNGIDKSKTKVLCYAEVNLEINGCSTRRQPFAVIDDDSIPCCFLLGANFLVINNLEIDFSRDLLVFNQRLTVERYLISCAFLNQKEFYRFGIDAYMGLSVISNDYCESDTDDEGSSELLIPKYVIPHDQLKKMQQGNYALKKLRTKLLNKVPTKHWNCPSIKQFKRSYKDLRLLNGLIVKGLGVNSSVVVSFPFLVELVSKTHTKLCHIGRQKLFDSIKSQFWHPGLERICGDFCRSCIQCQLCKTSKTEETPPVIKIKATRPFELVSVDLLMFERSRRGNIVLLVLVDHFSKWLAAVPIRDKRSETVARALKERILATLPRIPDRLLSDNGPEFIGSEFKGVLQEFNIEGCHSSPYHAPGNGACERMNRTIIQMLKVFDDRKWDENISNVVINYNNMKHSETNTSPSLCILTQQHDMKLKFPVDKEILQTWKLGHPNFCSYKVNQKVLKKVRRVGNLVRNKLEPRYEGPYIIKKVQSNGLSYEICKDDDETITKVNHRDLKTWYDVPKYLGKHLNEIQPEEPPADEDSWVTKNAGRGMLLLSSSDSEDCSSGSDSESTSSDQLSDSSEGSSSDYSDLSLDKVSQIGTTDLIDIERDAKVGDIVGSKPKTDNSHLCLIPNQSTIPINDHLNSKLCKDAEVQTEQSNIISSDVGNISEISVINYEKEINESRRLVKIMEQHVSVCVELLDTFVNENDLEIQYLNEAFDISSVTGIELSDDNIISHSTPISNRICNNRNLSISSVKSNEIDGSGSSAAIEFGTTKTFNHIIDVLERLNRICKENGGKGNAVQDSMDQISVSVRCSTDDSANNGSDLVGSLLNEATDTISELPNLTTIRTLRSRVIRAPRPGVFESKYPRKNQ